jgi:hypothetical protein
MAGAATAEGVVASTPSGVAWEAFVDSLREVGAAVAATPDPLDRAEGMRVITRFLSFGFDRFLEFADPERPRFFPVQGETRKYAGDNPDQLYDTAAIRGDRSYKVRGIRGNAVLVEIGVYAGNFSGGGERRLVAYLTEKELTFDADGSVELTLSPEPAPADDPHWLQIAGDASSVLVRQYFADPLDKRSSWEIEAEPAPDAAPPLSEAAVARSLHAVAAFTKTVLLWGGWLEGVKARGTNVLNALRDDGDLQTPDGVKYHQGHWRLAADQALVIEFTPASVPYWGFLIMNRWMESLEYRDRSVTLNNFQATTESDGRVRMIVAHEDPSLPNWLDTAGHHEGLMSLRWARLESPLPLVAVRVVPFASLAQETQ